MAFPGGTVVKNPPVSVGDARSTGSIPGWGRSPEVGNGNPLQHSCLENPWTEEPGGLSPWGQQMSDMIEPLNNNSNAESHSAITAVGVGRM